MSWEEIIKEHKAQLTGKQGFYTLESFLMFTYPAPQKWISVNDKLPEPNTPVLACIGVEYIIAWLDNGVWYIDDNNGVFPLPTHWQPLPEPPKTES